MSERARIKNINLSNEIITPGEAEVVTYILRDEQMNVLFYHSEHYSFIVYLFRLIAA